MDTRFPLTSPYTCVGGPYEGGMGVVWKVQKPGWNKPRAVKQIRRDRADDGSYELFLRECELATEMDAHPNVVHCYSFREMGGELLLFSEWMAGGSLKDKLNRGELADAPLYTLLDIALQCARGLQFLHGQNIVHSDVKPDNILFDGDNAKLTDFGVATALQDGTHTRSASVVGGTGCYAPIEYFERPRRLTRRSDIYAWALVLLEMLGGERSWEYGYYVASDPARFIARSRYPLPDPIKTLLTQCVQSDEGARPHDFGVVIAALAPFVKPTVPPHKPEEKEFPAFPKVDRLPEDLFEDALGSKMPVLPAAEERLRHLRERKPATQPISPLPRESPAARNKQNTVIVSGVPSRPVAPPPPKPLDKDAFKRIPPATRDAATHYQLGEVLLKRGRYRDAANEFASACGYQDGLKRAWSIRYQYLSACAIAQTKRYENGHFSDVDCIFGVTRSGKLAICCTDPKKSVNVLLHDWGLEEAAAWQDIVAVSGHYRLLAGLKRNGSVVVAGVDSRLVEKAVASWRDIVALCTTSGSVYGLRADGRVVVGDPLNTAIKSVETDWHDIIAIDADTFRLVGLRADGTLCVRNNCHQANDMCPVDLSNWHSIIGFSYRDENVIGLMINGQIVTGGSAAAMNNEALNWCDLAHVYSDTFSFAGITTQGMLVSTNILISDSVQKVRDIVAVLPHPMSGFFALRSDGAVLSLSDLEGEPKVLLTNIGSKAGLL